MKIPQPLHSTIAAIDAYHAARPDPWRAHLGASGLGHPCERYLWLGFRWSVREKFKGRILRLFRRGQMEEATVVSDLRAIGCEIHSTEDDQVFVQLAPHIGGSIDGIIESGLPEAPKSRHILEIKTHSLKSFTDLVKQGVEQSKPVHYAQMQLYMHGTGIERALYFAVCKDNDELHVERVKYDKAAAEKLLERGQRVVASDNIPPPISTDPTWYQCRFCPAHAMCHEGRPTEHVNCRTCAHSTASQDGFWHCERWNTQIPDEIAPQGCSSHVLHPDLVPWKMIDGDGVRATYEINGQKIINGENATPSKELV